MSNIFERRILVESADDDLAGEYLLEFVGSMAEGPQVGTEASFRFNLLIYDSSVLQNGNTAPVFVEDLPPVVEATTGRQFFTIDI